MQFARQAFFLGLISGTLFLAAGRQLHAGMLFAVGLGLLLCAFEPQMSR